MAENPDPYSLKPEDAPPPAGAVRPPGAYSPPHSSPEPINYATPGAAPTAYGGPPATSDDRSMALLCYILGIFGLFGWIGPLIVWLIKKDTSAFVNDQGKEVLNWELTIIIGYVACMFTFCIPFVNFLGMLCLFALLITNLVLCILGAIDVNKGNAHRMPFSIKFIK